LANFRHIFGENLWIFDTFLWLNLQALLLGFFFICLGQEGGIGNLLDLIVCLVCISAIASVTGKMT